LSQKCGIRSQPALIHRGRLTPPVLPRLLSAATTAIGDAYRAFALNVREIGDIMPRATAMRNEQLMPNHLPHPILSPVVLGPTASSLTCSSAGLPWRGVLLERHTCSAGERPQEGSLDRPVLVMLRSPAWRGERKAADGTFVPQSKTLGALTVVPKGLVPAVRSAQSCDLLYCAFDDTLVATVRDEIEGPFPVSLGVRSTHDNAVSEILNLLLAEVESGGQSGALYAESLAHALAVRFLYLGEHPPTRSSGTARLSERKLLRIRDLVESRLQAGLTLQELAAEIGYSRSHFLRMFRATTGITPHRYVLKLRIERARRLLGQADISVADVAYSCGFSSQAHLTLAFRKACGATPAEYRRQTTLLVRSTNSREKRRGD
jgi:AraC family transcriptional regulator